MHIPDAAARCRRRRPRPNQRPTVYPRQYCSTRCRVAALRTRKARGMPGRAVTMPRHSGAASSLHGAVVPPCFASYTTRVGLAWTRQLRIVPRSIQLGLFTSLDVQVGGDGVGAGWQSCRNRASCARHVQSLSRVGACRSSTPIPGARGEQSKANPTWARRSVPASRLASAARSLVHDPAPPGHARRDRQRHCAV